ncbi:MAG: PH domain-containing protein [Clostridiales bacterium]|nr:PH domain-containing protein [Candidatus Blautia equi]
MLDITEGGDYVLNPAGIDSANPHVKDALIEGEKIYKVFNSDKGQFVFTDKRLLTVETYGFWGKKYRIFILKYGDFSKMGMETTTIPGKLQKNGVLFAMFMNGKKARMKLMGKHDLNEFVMMVAKYK